MLESRLHDLKRAKQLLYATTHSNSDMAIRYLVFICRVDSIAQFTRCCELSHSLGPLYLSLSLTSFASYSQDNHVTVFKTLCDARESLAKFNDIDYLFLKADEMYKVTPHVCDAFSTCSDEWLIVLV